MLGRHRCPPQKENKPGWNGTPTTSMYIQYPSKMARFDRLAPPILYRASSCVFIFADQCTPAHLLESIASRISNALIMYSRAAQPSTDPCCHSNVRVKPHQSHPITSQTSSRSDTSNTLQTSSKSNLTVKHIKHIKHINYKHQAGRTHQTRKLSTTVNHQKPSSAPDLG